ncbi:glycoside hydrolase superfamily [Fusarium sp. MPI-SDFR-AT-0072]|nr:glycoside hydrolase superfamily [Fusarium sp. MPI-SDFR-AT-0072]
MHRRIWLLGLLLLCLCIAVAADDTTCSATKRCKNSYCNKSGNCGFGPDYMCRLFKAEEDKCPLNIYCSKHGYCGIIKRPSCSKSRGVERVVGYFEGWARTRPCNTFWPEQILIGLYTHINFAFATINPKTFLVEIKDKDNYGNLYERLTALKKKDPDLKIYLAIGGWAFNNPGKTSTTFSELATSQDIDKDQGGHSGDYKNFPKFMEKLKKTLNRGDKGLTITLPVSYWYLRYFDIKRLVSPSYDLHGAWDQKADWTEPCSEPGCLFKDAGRPGKYSAEAGILLNSEIDDITKKRGLKPKLYKEEAVKVLKWGNQWVSYDDEETLKIKTEFTQSHYLSGALV